MRRELLPSWARPISFLACFAASFVSFAAPVRAGDWYVDAQAADCVHADGSAAAPFCTIGEAVNVAVSGDTVYIAAGTYFELLTLDRSLTLVGTGGASVTTVDGGGLGSVVAIISAASVALEGLTITHGKAQYGGGIHVIDACNLTLTASAVVNNQADAIDGAGARLQSSGGGVFATRATVVVTATSFSDNFANASGGAIRSEYGSITVTDSTFTHNVSGDSAGFGGGGGAIYGWGDGSMILARSTFDANRSDNPNPSDGGGAIYSAGDMVADELLVRANTAFLGGGIVSGHTMTLRDSTVEDNTAKAGGGLVTSENSVVERCTIRGNRAEAWTWNGGHGGGIAGAGTITDCLIENNTSDSGNFGNGSTGGGLDLVSASVLRCVIRGNTVTSGDSGGLGGGAYISNGTTVVDCAIIGNSALSASPETAGWGGGLVLADTPFYPTITISRCTIAGNSTIGKDAPGVGDGGGIKNFMRYHTPSISHVVIAGNSCAQTGGAADCSGTFDSQGYNLIGDTTGCKITGDDTGNQLDVDPLFADPGNGDFSLRFDSPALDAGDRTVRVAGADVSGNPRVLDGDLDHTMVVDLGAYEFDNVHLDVTGDAKPGGTLTFASTGTAGLPILMLVGSVRGELLAPPFGTLFLDFADPWLLLPWGSVPDQRSWNVDSSVPVPSEWILQPLVLEAATRAGNLGNAVRLDFE